MSDGTSIQHTSTNRVTRAVIDTVDAIKNTELEASDNKKFLLSDSEWTTEKSIDELQCNLASVEQIVTSKSGQTLTIRKYQSQCRKLAPWIPIALPTPEYLIYASDLKPEMR